VEQAARFAFQTARSTDGEAAIGPALPIFLPSCFIVLSFSALIDAADHNPGQRRPLFHCAASRLNTGGIEQSGMYN